MFWEPEPFDWRLQPDSPVPRMFSPNCRVSRSVLRLPVKSDSVHQITPDNTHPAVCTHMLHTGTHRLITAGLCRNSYKTTTKVCLFKSVALVLILKGGGGGLYITHLVPKHTHLPVFLSSWGPLFTSCITLPLTQLNLIITQINSNGPLEKWCSGKRSSLSPNKKKSHHCLDSCSPHNVAHTRTHTHTHTWSFSQLGIQRVKKHHLSAQS